MTVIACGSQGSLNFEPVPSRRTDPVTSTLAANEHRESGRAGTHCSIVLGVLRASSEPLTYREIFKRCGGDISEPAEVMRRLNDMRRAGLVRQEQARPCRAGNGKRLATTWRAA